MRSRAAHFDDLRAYLNTVPLVDCHDHTPRPHEMAVKVLDIFGSDTMTIAEARA